MNILVFGEILWDIIEEVPLLGGAPLNFAVHVNRFGNNVAIISCLGKDQLGDKALQKVEEFGIDTSLIQRSDKPTGYVPVTLENGQPEYEIIKDVAYDYIQFENLDHASISSYDVFYFGSLIQRGLASSQSLHNILGQHHFENIFYDVNLRTNAYTKEVIEYSLNHCTILKVNYDEVVILSQMLFGLELDFVSFCANISSIYSQIKIIIMTSGKAGCQVYSDTIINKIPTEPIEVVDTVGAGDSFSAAFLAVYSKTLDPIASAQIANEVGGFVASSYGAIPDYPEGLIAKLKS